MIDIKNRGNNIFSIGISDPLTGPGVTSDIQFQLPNNLTDFGIKSIYWDYQLFVSAAGPLPSQPVPYAQNTENLIFLNIGDYFAATPKIARTFENAAPAATVSMNGQSFTMFNPGQMFFNNFFVNQVLNFRIMHTNKSLVSTYDLLATVVVEMFNL